MEHVGDLFSSLDQKREAYLLVENYDGTILRLQTK